MGRNAGPGAMYSPQTSTDAPRSSRCAPPPSRKRKAPESGEHRVKREPLGSTDQVIKREPLEFASQGIKREIPEFNERGIKHKPLNSLDRKVKPEPPAWDDCRIKQDIKHEHDPSDLPPPKKRKTKDPNAEERLRRHRSRAPTTHQSLRTRALTQRMFVLSRERSASPSPEPSSTHPTHPIETLTLAGSTGNIYTISISRLPTCTCPHFLKGHAQCKHIIYALTRVLRAPETLEYQLAFLSSELHQIFAHAPSLPEEKVAGEGKAQDPRRKEVAGECPICCEDFASPEQGGQVEEEEEIVYCKAACGNNIHRTCFAQWAAAKPAGKVTCPFCRTAWEADDLSKDLGKLAATGKVNEEGYVNVAAQLGLSGRRDYSTYHQPWVRRQMGYGYGGGGW